MSDLFAEVDEVMRQERLEQIWKDNKSLIIAFLGGTILLTAIISGYKSWNANAQSKQTNLVFELLEASNFPDNINPNTIKTRDSLKALVILQAASAQLEKGETEKAQELYNAASKIKGAKKYRDLSKLMTARLNKNQSPAESLQDILQNKNNPWHAQALLNLATYEASNKNFSEALKALETLINTPKAPQSLRQKAEALKHVYTIQNTSKTQAK